MQPDTRPSPGSIPAVLLAARFLFPLDDDRHAEDPNWRTAGRWLVFWGLAIGVTYTLVFRISWRWFGEYQYIRWMPAAAVLLIDLGCCGYRFLTGAARIASRRYTCEADTAPFLNPAGLVAVLLVAIAKYAMLLSLPIGTWQSSLSDVGDHAAWASRLGYLYPDVIYRPLVLMPLWGRWGIMLAMSIGRVAPGGSYRLRRMAGGTHLSMILVYWLLAAALTGVYCGGSGGYLARGLAVALGVMLASYLASFALARRAGGQTEATTAVAGLVAELAFLSLYLPVASSIYWY